MKRRWHAVELRRFYEHAYIDLEEVVGIAADESFIVAALPMEESESSNVTIWLRGNAVPLEVHISLRDLTALMLELNIPGWEAKHE